jgi:hypothetical protein
MSERAEGLTEAAKRVVDAAQGWRWEDAGPLPTAINALADALVPSERAEVGRERLTVEQVRADEVAVGDMIWDDGFKRVTEIRNSDPNDRGPTIYCADEATGDMYHDDEPVLRRATPSPTPPLLHRLDEALLDGPGGEVEAVLIYAAMEIKRLSPHDPTPGLLRAFAAVLIEERKQ